MFDASVIANVLYISEGFHTASFVIIASHTVSRRVSAPSVALAASCSSGCQLPDHAKQCDNDDACHNKRNGGNLHGNISRNGNGNAMIGRYGGCFDEDIRRVYAPAKVVRY